MNNINKATFSAGCFWGVEAAFRKAKGVVSTRVGYTGGTLANPNYEDVCHGKTGHAEAIEIQYDSSMLSYEELLDIFWSIHNPTTPNRQGFDIGAQYRSSIFYHDKTQQNAAMLSKEKLQKSQKYGKRKIVTEIIPASDFYPAEDYHQRYLEKNQSFVCSSI